MLILIVLIVVAAVGYAAYWLTRPAEIDVLFKKGVSGEDALITIAKYGGGNIVSRMAPDPKPKAFWINVNRIQGLMLENKLRQDPNVEWVAGWYH